MGKRAVIYVRTSSERGGKKVSPREQEDACRELATEHGHTVVKVYKDIERYRLRGRGKLVEPSGTRADRPALCEMIADGKAGEYDVILAWREDRLYRAFRPMLNVLELVESYGIDIELVKETFDKKMAPGKAWVAKMELEGIKERMEMGRIGRLKDKKMLGHPNILGYDIVDGQAAINESEAETVRFIFAQVAWGDADHPSGVPIKELRRRLVARGDKQKTDTPKKKPWARGVIYSILNTETYLGAMTYHVDGETYKVPVPPIIDQETFDKAHENMRGRQRYPVRNARELGFLLMGKLYDPHGHRMNYRINRYNYYATKASGGKKVRQERKNPLAYGTCSVAYDDGPCDFRRVVRLRAIEQAVWDKVAPFLLDPQNIKQVASELVAKWQGDRKKHRADVEKLERLLARLKEERQWVITQGRKGVLTDDDMAEQLVVVTQEERDARRKLADAKRAANAGAGLLQMVNELADFLRSYEGELMELASIPLKDMSLEQRKIVQRWFDAVVVRVDLEGEGDDLRISTDAFGLLRTMTNKSTMTRHR